MSMMPMMRAFFPLLLLAASACGGSGAEGEDGANMDAGEAPDAAAGAAELAQDAELANEAAADEAADVEAFGGNAAAMEGNRQ